MSSPVISDTVAVQPPPPSPPPSVPLARFPTGGHRSDPAVVAVMVALAALTVIVFTLGFAIGRWSA